MLAQVRCWRAELARSREAVLFSTLRDGLSDEHQELRGLEIEVPLERWNEVVRPMLRDRKLLGGVLLRFTDEEAQAKRLTVAMASDRLFGELQRVLSDATLALVGEGLLVLAPPAPEAEEI